MLFLGYHDTSTASVKYVAMVQLFRHHLRDREPCQNQCKDKFARAMIKCTDDVMAKRSSSSLLLLSSVEKSAGEAGWPRV